MKNDIPLHRIGIGGVQDRQAGGAFPYSPEYLVAGISDSDPAKCIGFGAHWNIVWQTVGPVTAAPERPVLA